MWTITETDIEQAKGRLQLRRANIETRYAEETKALDAEFAAIATLERAATEFALRHGRKDASIASEAAAPTDSPGDGEVGGAREETGLAGAPDGDRAARRRRHRRRPRHPQARLALAHVPQHASDRRRNRAGHRFRDRVKIGHEIRRRRWGGSPRYRPIARSRAHPLAEAQLASRGSRWSFARGCSLL
jgi:hypothetical protein